MSVVVVVMLAVSAGYALYWYAPWMLVIDTTVNDPLSVRPPGEPDPTRTNAVEEYLVLTGTFISQQHKTSGTARVVRPEGRGNLLRLELVDFSTSNGPDLRVWLSDQPVKADKSSWRVFGTGRRLDLGQLKGNKGNQTYAIPTGTRLSGLYSVTIWSGRFDVSYGAAALF